MTQGLMATALTIALLAVGGLADGQTVVRESINACRISDYYLTL
jgi:hypothetical protein